jgi:hypothetical protein
VQIADIGLRKRFVDLPSTSIGQSKSANCSFVKPASRINARSVPLANLAMIWNCEPPARQMAQNDMTPRLMIDRVANFTECLHRIGA